MWRNNSKSPPSLRIQGTVELKFHVARLDAEGTSVSLVIKPRISLVYMETRYRDIAEGVAVRNDSIAFV